MNNDKRIVLTLDAGGTNFVFSAMRRLKEIVAPVRLPSNADNLDKCLATMVEGFEKVIEQLEEKPVAISFAFPGPADYPNGIIGDLGNLPAFRGGVALGPFLEEQFGMPVFINNDGDLFVYGEGIAGLLPKVNKMLEEAGAPKRYKNLFGVTLGTGFGGGLVVDGELYLGDNSGGLEIWITRNKKYPKCYAEMGVGIAAVRRFFAEAAGVPFDEVPSPKDLYDIATGVAEGNVEAAKKAFADMGEVLGDALANAITLLDGIIVIGGGLSAAYPLFIDAVLAELNGTIEDLQGNKLPRIVQDCFDLENPSDVEKFIKGKVTDVTVPGTNRKVKYDSMKRIGIGRAVLDTSFAVSVGAYAYALNQLDK
ncbi:MAG: ROK family protein [Phycisphaerae bacterium]